MGALDQEGMDFPPRPQRSDGSLLSEPQFPHPYNGSTETLEFLWLLDWAVLGDPPSPPSWAGW